MEKKEVKVCSNCLGNNIGKVFNEKAYFRSTKGHKPVGLDMCLDCGCYDTCSVKELLDKAREGGRREVLRKLKEEIDMAEVSEFVDTHQDFFNGLGESMLLKLSKFKDNK